MSMRSLSSWSMRSAQSKSSIEQRRRACGVSMRGVSECLDVRRRAAVAPIWSKKACLPFTLSTRTASLSFEPFCWASMVTFAAYWLTNAVVI